MSAPTRGRWLVVARTAFGTRHLAHLLAHWITAPEVKGRGPRVRAVVGRVLSLTAVAWFLGGMLWALGMPPWGLVPVWLVSALAASYTAEDRPAGKPAAAAPAARPAAGREQLLAALDEITRGTTGAHLWPTVYQGLRAYPRYAELADTELRALLDEHGVPVKTITVRGIRGRNGVSRAAIEALLSPTPPPAPEAGSGAEESADLRKSSSSARPEAAPEGVVCIPQEVGDDTLAMLRQGVTGR